MKKSFIMMMVVGALTMSGSAGAQLKTSADGATPRARPQSNLASRPGSTPSVAQKDDVEQVAANGRICAENSRITDIAYDYGDSGTYHFVIDVRDENGETERYQSYKAIDFDSTRALLDMTVSAMMSQAAVSLYIRGDCSSGGDKLYGGYDGLKIMAVY